MLPAPLSSLTEWISTRAPQAIQPLDKDQHLLLLQAALALESQRLLRIGSGGRSMTLSSMDLLGRLRELRDDVCADVWRLALETEYPHLERRSVREAFRRPHPLVLGLMAAWAVDALGDRPTLRDRIAKAQLTITTDKAERIARLWAVRVLGNGCGNRLDPDYLQDACARLVPIVEGILRTNYSTLGANSCENLRIALLSITGEVESLRLEPRDVAELFTTKTKESQVVAPPMRTDGLFRVSPQGLQGSIFAPSYGGTMRPPPLRLPRPGTETVLEHMHTCRDLLAPMWTRLTEQGVQPLFGLRDAAKNTFPLAREWAESFFTPQPDGLDAHPRSYRLPFMPDFQLPGSFFTNSDASTLSNSSTSQSGQSIEENWQLVDEVDD